MRITKKSQKQREFNLGVILPILLLISIFSIILPLVQAMPQIQLISQTNPLEYGSIQTLMINLTTNDTNITIEQALIEFEEQNHTLEKANDSYTYNWIPQQMGNYTYAIYATDSTNETQTSAGSFTVRDTQPPEITETAPNGILNYNLLELKAITNKNSTCKYDEADVSYDSMYFALSGEGLIHTQLRSFSEGPYTAYVRCKDKNNNVGQSKTISFIINTKPPTITALTPTGTVNQQQITLKFDTDEIATCKWSRTNQAYDYLENYFQTTYALHHEQPLTLSEGINTYYISCQDQAGNKNPLITINLELSLPPKATIGVEIPQNYKALAAGTYQVNLLATKSLAQAPSLALRYGTRLVNIPLEGSTNYWKGYLIMPADAGEEVGEFIFSGIDNKGTSGTEITAGKLILIDTSPPAMPTGLNLLNENRKIKLSWDYEGEEPDHFNIYKSTTGKTGKSDFNAISTEKAYEDSNITNKIGYFYRISAVDKAGNEGLLSDEDFLMTDFQNDTGFQQETRLLEIINNKINELESTVQEIEVETAKLEDTTDRDLLGIINSKGLVEKQKEAESKIQTLIGELKTYRETAITRDALTTKIAIIDEKLNEYKKDIIKEVLITNKIENEQMPDENLLQEAIKEYLKNKVLNDEQKSQYQSQVKELQNAVRIRQKIISYSIEYKYQQIERITTITETIISSNNLSGVLIQEIVPREAVKVSEINFEKTPKEFNSLGFIWDLKELDNNEAKYGFNNETDLNQLQMIRTVLLYDVDEFLGNLSDEKTNASNELTSNVISQKKQGFVIGKEILIPFGILIIIGLLIYYFVFLKTDNAYQKETFFIAEQDNFQAVSTIKTDLSSILGLVQKSYLELERQDTDAASTAYYAAFSLYMHVNLNLKDRLKVNFEMNTLYERILEKQNSEF